MSYIGEQGRHSEFPQLQSRYELKVTARLLLSLCCYSPLYICSCPSHLILDGPNLFVLFDYLLIVIGSCSLTKMTILHSFLWLSLPVLAVTHTASLFSPTQRLHVCVCMRLHVCVCV